MVRQAHHDKLVVSLVLQRQLNQQKHQIDQNPNPPGEDTQQVEKNEDDRPEAEEDSLSQRNAQNFSFIPCVDGEIFPQEEKENRGDTCDTQEDAQEEDRQRLAWRGEGTDAQHHDRERGDRQECRGDDAEEEGGHEYVMVSLSNHVALTVACRPSTGSG